MTFVGDHLEARGRSFGSGLRTLQVELFFPFWPFGKGKNRVESDPDYDAALEKLPWRRFARKRELLEVRWRARRQHPDEAAETLLKDVSVRLFNQAFDDLIEATEYGLAAIRRSDDVDAEGLISWMREVRAEPRGSDLDLQWQIGKDHYHIREMREGSGWLDDMDWSKVPSAARELMDDPRDWSESYEFAAHGNDTGADILNDWSRWHRASPERAADYFVAADDPDGDDGAWWRWVQVCLALAFGHIRKRGTCPPELARVARHAISREKARTASLDDWEYRDEWVGCLDRCDRILSRFG